jgi:hypothetical protein
MYSISCVCVCVCVYIYIYFIDLLISWETYFRNLISLSSIFSHYHFLYPYGLQRFLLLCILLYLFLYFLLVMQDTNNNLTVIILERDLNIMWNMVGLSLVCWMYQNFLYLSRYCIFCGSLTVDCILLHGIKISNTVM